jgi:hypothetical protein
MGVGRWDRMQASETARPCGAACPMSRRFYHRGPLSFGGVGGPPPAASRQACTAAGQRPPLYLAPADAFGAIARSSRPFWLVVGG